MRPHLLLIIDSENSLININGATKLTLIVSSNIEFDVLAILELGKMPAELMRISTLHILLTSFVTRPISSMSVKSAGMILILLLQVDEMMSIFDEDNSGQLVCVCVCVCAVVSAIYT